MKRILMSLCLVVFLAACGGGGGGSEKECEILCYYFDGSGTAYQYTNTDCEEKARELSIPPGVDCKVAE